LSSCPGQRRGDRMSASRGSDEAEDTPFPDSLWRNRDYTLLLGGQVISFIGSQVQQFALPLLVLAISGSATEAGVVLGLSTFAYLVFGLFAGAMVDRWNRKTTMIVCDLGRAIVTATVPIALWSGHLAMPQLYAVSLLSGILQTFFDVADSASIPNVVGTKQLSKALGYTESAFNAIAIAGGLVAGVLYGLSRTVPFAANAISYAFSALTLGSMKVRFQVDRTEEPPRNVLLEIREGFSWLKNQPVIRFLTMISAADSLRYGAGYLVIITLAERVGASSYEIGFIFSGAAAGSLIGALLSGRINERFSLGRVAVVMFWVEALTFPFYVIAPNPLLIGMVAAGESLVAPIYLVAMKSYRLRITPDALRGRTTSTTQTISTGALSLGAVLGGVMIAGLGARATALIFGGWLILLAVLTTANRAVRQAGSTADPTDEQPSRTSVHDGGPVAVTEP
jgi:MFS family permease